mmetsp:Transcript_13121/g.47860  ORF Transcript_13121/g.47860 Transcript_13121/m.47860 type:complete len:275 (-) Transcript_13121:1033-1857(-)
MPPPSEVNHADQLRLIEDVEVPHTFACTPCTLEKCELGKWKPAAGETNAVHKLVHFIRHGHGYHNLLATICKEQGVKFSSAGKGWRPGSDVFNPYAHPELIDPPLTQRGVAEAVALRELSARVRPQMVVVSPMRRAARTAVLAFDTLVGKVPFVAHEGCREQMGIHMCDKRQTKQEAVREFPEVSFDHVLHDEDILWSCEDRESKQEMALRACRFLDWLGTLDETEIVVATHSSFLFTLFNKVLLTDNDEIRKWFNTGELRSVVVGFPLSEEAS